MRQNRTPLNLPQFEVPALVNAFIFYHTLAITGPCVLLYKLSNVTLKFCAANFDVDLMRFLQYEQYNFLFTNDLNPFAMRMVPQGNSFCKEDDGPV